MNGLKRKGNRVEQVMAGTLIAAADQD